MGISSSFGTDREAAVRNRVNAWYFRPGFSHISMHALHPDHDSRALSGVAGEFLEQLTTRCEEPGQILEDGHTLLVELNLELLSGRSL